MVYDPDHYLVIGLRLRLKTGENFGGNRFSGVIENGVLYLKGDSCFGQHDFGQISLFKGLM